jgi:hypothetical protein
MDNFDLKKYIIENRVTKQSLLNENEIARNIENLVDEKGWESWDDVENEIEEIREKFDLLDSTSRYDEAWGKFEELYHANPIQLKKYFEN